MNWLYILPGTGEFVKRRGYRCLVFGGRDDDTLEGERYGHAQKSEVY